MTSGTYVRLGAAVFAAAALTALVPQGALGQAGTTTGVRSSAYNSWGGSFDASPYGALDMADKVEVGKVHLKPHLGTWITLDRNVFFTEEDEVEDWSLTVAPGVLLLLGNPSKNYLSANFDYQWVMYQDETTEDYSGPQLAADAHYDLARTTLHVSERYSDTRLRAVEDSQEVERQANVLSASAERYLSSKTSAGLDGLYEIHNYVKDDYVDYYEYRAGGRLYYRVFPKTDVFGDLGYGWVNLDPLPASLNDALSDRFDRQITGSYGDATYQQVSVGVRGELGRKTTASGRVGYEHREFEDASIEDIDTWVTGAGLATKFTGRMEGGVEVSRRIFPWSTVPGNSAVALAVSPYVRRQLYRNRVSGSISATYEEIDYYDPAGKTDRNDETLTVTGLVDWRVRRNFTTGVGYSYTRYDTTESDATTERDRIIIRANYNY